MENIIVVGVALIGLGIAYYGVKTSQKKVSFGGAFTAVLSIILEGFFAGVISRSISIITILPLAGALIYAYKRFL